jgi:uncharacterized membrane protein
MKSSDTEMNYMIRRKVITWITIVLSMPLVLVLFASCSRQPSYPPPLQNGTDVIIEVNELQPETPKFYTYGYQGKSINFFVIRIQDKVLAFLDACVTCFPHKKGYRCEEGAVTCRYCNTKFSIYQLEKGLGSCAPIKIEGRIEGGQYRIPARTLEEAAGKF